MPPAHQLDGVRLTRRDGSYRQTFEVENANRAMRLAGLGAPITVSLPDHNEDAAYSFQDGHLKVVSSRKFTPNVPFECTEGKFSFDDAPNPFNQMGALLEDNIPLVTSNDFESFLAAFGKRSNFVQQGKDDDISDAAFNEALAIIRDFKVPQAWSEWDENPEDRERWLSKFDIHKRRRMEKAYEELLEVDSKDLGQKDLSVKLEVLLKRNDETWAPRVIYAGTDAFNAVTGPVMMVFMERLVEALQKCSVGVVKVKLAYKTNDVSLAEFLDDPELPNTYEGDFSANDREQRSRVALLFDEWMCKLKLPQWTRTLFLEMDRYKVQNQRFGITAHLKYQLPTGTTSTTARNSTYNLTMFAVACARQHVTKAKACVLGDDILARTMQKFSVVLWKQTVDEDFKMKLKGKEPALNGQATLLSRRIIIDGDTKCMIPLIGKALARFNARASINEAVSDSQYMAGKSLSYAYEFRHVPYLRDRFLERYEMEDTAAVTLDDLTWFARTSGVDLSNLVQAIRDEKVLVSDGMFLDWLMETYDMGLCDIDELFRMVVLNKCPEIITHPAVAQLAIDW